MKRFGKNLIDALTAQTKEADECDFEDGHLVLKIGLRTLKVKLTSDQQIRLITKIVRVLQHP